MQAVILAGGRGTRLRGVVDDRPKPLAEIAGRPFIAYLLDRLAAAPVDAVVLSVGYRHEMIRAALGDQHGRLPLRYVVEDEPLGTGGGLRQALRSVEGADAFVLNGDSVVDVDFAALAATHARLGRALTVTAVHLDEVGRYGALRLAGDRLAGFAEKTACGPGWINAGVYAMRRDLCERWPLPRRFSFEEEILVRRSVEIAATVFRTRGFFIDIGVPEDYARAQQSLPGR